MDARVAELAVTSRRESWLRRERESGRLYDRAAVVIAAVPGRDARPQFLAAAARNRARNAAVAADHRAAAGREPDPGDRADGAAVAQGRDAPGGGGRARQRPASHPPRRSVLGRSPRCRPCWSRSSPRCCSRAGSNSGSRTGRASDAREHRADRSQATYRLRARPCRRPRPRPWPATWRTGFRRVPIDDPRVPEAGSPSRLYRVPSTKRRSSGSDSKRRGADPSRSSWGYDGDDQHTAAIADAVDSDIREVTARMPPSRRHPEPDLSPH